MEKWQREHIKKNLVQLMKDTNCDEDFLSNLIAPGYITDSEAQILLSNKALNSRNMKFYTMIQSRTGVYGVLIDALRETSQSGPANLLEEGYPGGERQIPLSVPTIQLQTPTPPSKPDAPITMGNPSWDSGAGGPPAPPSQDEVDFVNNMEPLEVFVRRPSSKMAFPNDAYKLSESFKGYALIINIIEFVNSAQNRGGAKQDTQYMNKLWSQLGYHVTIYEGAFTFDQVSNILNEFRKQFTKTTNDSPISCVIFFGSHGSFSKIESSDHKHIDLYRDIIYKFNSKECPQLKGKPKIFLIQACQRFQTDDPVPNRNEVDRILETPIDDTVVGFSTIPGYVSNRDLYLGTWYTYCLAQVFMTEAHHMDLLSMLKKTQEKMRSINAQGPDEGQLSSYSDLGIKTTYFNLSPA